MTNFERYSLYVSGAAALGTIILAILAIFGGMLRRLFIKPKIRMTILDKEPYVELVEENSPNESEKNSYKKIHLKINNNGTQTALNSQIVIEKVFKKRENNQTFYCDKSFIPCNFLWINEKENKSISPSISHFIEIARIQKYQQYSSDNGSKSSVRNSDLYRLWLSIEQTKEKGTYMLLGKGTFVFPVIFYSDNVANPIEIFIEIFFDCDTLEVMNDSNFYIKVVEKKNLSNEIRQGL
jgi:poly(A) polymerase Pap1